MLSKARSDCNKHKKPRECYNANGTPKVKYDDEIVPPKGYVCYRCPYCGKWHLGKEKAA